jgi:uncharacterized membrane protein YbhN (UPF0104 family)
MEGIRRMLLVSESAILLLAIMFLGSLALWVGVPVGWLWIGSQIQAQTDSVGLALLSMMVGITLNVAILLASLTWLNRKHVELDELRGRRRDGPTPLERVLVSSAVVALLAFTVWFFGLSGAAPLPGLDFKL